MKGISQPILLKKVNWREVIYCAWHCLIADVMVLILYSVSTIGVPHKEIQFLIIMLQIPYLGF